METPSSSMPGKSKLPGMPIFLWMSIASPSAADGVPAEWIEATQHENSGSIWALHPNACPGT